LAKTRQVRDAIKAKIEKFVEDVAAGKAGSLDFSQKNERGE
jgi:hypothetical protein